MESNGVFLRCWFALNGESTVWLKKLLLSELLISGSGSANVGDRGICGLKPLYLPLHKSCIMAYTSALANMICIVNCLPAYYILAILDLCERHHWTFAKSLIFLCRSASKIDKKWVNAKILLIHIVVYLKDVTYWMTYLT